MKFEEVFAYSNLYNSYLLCLKGVKWKGTVQHYDSYAISNIYQTKKDLYNNAFKTGKFFCFNRMERGKLREIKSVKINERVVQRCLCDYCLVPLLTTHFIFDNSACVKGKGVHFAQDRMKYHLQKFYKLTHSNKGYILQFDMHHYFETIPHDKLIAKVSKCITDQKLIKIYSQLVNDFGGTKGLGLGSQISQISALFYMSDIDHTILKMKGVIAYARYMDDGYVIAKDKETLIVVLNTFKRLVQELGLKINKKKTLIKPLNNTINFLKIRYNLLKSGKIVMRIDRTTIVRNRRKLKKLFKNKIKLIDIENYVKSVIGNWKRYKAFYTIKNFLILYNKLKEIYL